MLRLSLATILKFHVILSNMMILLWNESEASDWYYLHGDCVTLHSQSQSSGVNSTARVILGQVLSFLTCGSRTHTEMTTCD